MERYDQERREMVEWQIRNRGVSDERVLAAMLEVPREAFVPKRLKGHAYDDSPLPIGDGQTISQPYIVALMTEALQLGPKDRLLEIGTGSGYAAAVAARIAAEVYTVERIPELAEEALQRFIDLGYGNIHVLIGDGTLGWPEHAPFDAVCVTAGAPSVPAPLLDQLTMEGRLVIPVGKFPLVQELIRLRKTPSGVEKEDLGSVQFVPLVGAEGWGSPVERFFHWRKF